MDTRAWLQKLEASKGQAIAAKAKTETNYSCAEQMKQNAPAHAINWQAVFRLPGFSGRTAKPTRACNIRQNDGCQTLIGGVKSTTMNPTQKQFSLNRAASIKRVTISNMSMQRDLNRPGIGVPFPYWLLVLFLMTLPATSRANDYIYDYNFDGGITITAYSGFGAELTIPETIDGLPVTRIGNGVFQGRGDLTVVSIPTGVTHIGSDAFASCGNLTNVSVPATLTSIESYPLQNAPQVPPGSKNGISSSLLILLIPRTPWTLFSVHEGS